MQELFKEEAKRGGDKISEVPQNSLMGRPAHC